MKPLSGAGSSPVKTSLQHAESSDAAPPESSGASNVASTAVVEPPPSTDVHEGLGARLKHMLHDIRHPPPPVRSTFYLQIEAAVHETLAHPSQLDAQTLKALAFPLSQLEPADVRRLNELLEPTLMPWNRADGSTLFGALAEKAGLPASVAAEATASALAQHHDFRRVDGPVQATLDRVLKGEKLSADEFGPWLHQFLALPANDRRNIAKQLFAHLGLHPAKQEEVAREVAVRAGLPPEVADGVPHYQAGQDLTFVASLAYRFGLPLVSVGVSAGVGGMIQEKNLETGEHTPVVVAPEGVSAGIAQFRAVESIEDGHVKSRVGLIGTTPLAIGIGAGVDPIFGPVVTARFGPLTNFFVGEGALGARVPVLGGFFTGTGVALSIAAREPRLDTLTDGVIQKAHLLGVEAHELTQYVKRLFHGNDNAPVVGLLDHQSPAP